MEEQKKKELENIAVVEQEERSSFDFRTIYTMLILNWKWFLLSLVICLGIATIYLRYATPQFQAYAKFLIKDDQNNNGRSMGQMMMNNLGTITNSAGIDNEIEILYSQNLAQQAVTDLKLYTTYRTKGKFKEILLYKNQPINVEINKSSLDELKAPINLEIDKEKSGYHVICSYYYSKDEDSPATLEEIDRVLPKLPATLKTKVGVLTFTKNRPMDEGQTLLVKINTPKNEARHYTATLNVSPTSKLTTIAQLTVTDESPERAVDFLKQLSVCYNRQANEDKNEVAIRTEEFINSRLEKISAELGSTEGALEEFKKRNNMVELKLNATRDIANQDEFYKKLADMNVQVALLKSIEEYMNQPENKYQTLPSNVGLNEASAVNLINRYNELALMRNNLLLSATENHPEVIKMTSQLDDLTKSIRRAMQQASRNMNIQRNAIGAQYNKFQGQISATPEQERILSQIGRQQEVKAGLYLMLLQKREENSISLAATADKGRLIDEPVAGGKVKPKSSIIMLAALILGIAIPFGIIFILQFFRYRIEGHDDVARLTQLPIIADVAVASDTAKTKADIVVHENKNNQMEEIFRSMRTNLQFMLKENEKVIMFTSSTSGEGKTFNAANLSVSFALLGKKVILVGLDIRKPRLAELFEIDDHKHGITNLLVKESPTIEELNNQIIPSNINQNLDLLMAGPTPPNPTELLARKSLEIIVKNLRSMYDIIIIDTAPVGLVTDTMQIGRVADITVIACRADYTAKESFNLINSLSYEKKLPNMCIILNGIDMSKKKYGYYYGYGSYGRYGRYGRYGHASRYGGYSSYGQYGNYGNYGIYGNYTNSHYGNKNDTSIKK